MTHGKCIDKPNIFNDYSRVLIPKWLSFLIESHVLIKINKGRCAVYF